MSRQGHTQPTGARKPGLKQAPPPPITNENKKQTERGRLTVASQEELLVGKRSDERAIVLAGWEHFAQ